MIESVFAAWAEGDIQPFLDAMSDDFRWVFPASWSWSGTWEPKAVVVQDLLRGGIGSRLNGPFRQEPDFVLIDGDQAVVQTRGYGTTRSGDAYNNTYCLVFQIRDGRLTEVIEHCDAALVDRVLGPPPAA